MARKAGLTKKEKAFCEYFVFENMSATNAYLAAYECGWNTAKSAGYRVLKKPHIKEYIEALQKEAWEAAAITAEKIGLKLAEIAFAAKDDEYYTPNQQIRGLELLQKQLGLQTQKVEADLHTDINITLNTYTTIFNKYKEEELKKVNAYYLNNDFFDETKLLSDSELNSDLNYELEL